MSVLLVVDNGRLQVVEGDKIGDLLGFRILHHICPHDLLLARRWLVHQPVINFIPGESLVHVEPKQIPLQKSMDSVNSLGLHWPPTRSRSGRREMILSDLAGLGRAMGKR